MTGTLRIALAQFDFPVGDIAGNAERILRLIAEARDVHGADLVVFPELALSGYPPEDLLLRPAFLAQCQQAMETLAMQVQGIVAVVGWPQAAGPAVFNAANEVAVAGFLRGGMPFGGIADVIDCALQAWEPAAADSIENVMDADRRARETAGAALRSIC